MEIRYSLEQHLHDMASLDKRIQSLESIYIIQKEKMEHFLSTIKTTFPTYSTHDVYHSYHIIIAIEEILGKKRMEKLSGADAFLLLICAYMHDLGMLYTDEEVRSLWKSKEFQSFLSNCVAEGSSLKEAAEMVRGMEKKDASITWPLEIKKSIGLLLMAFFRSRHGERIEKVTDKRYGRIAECMEFDHSFLPERISRLIYRICMSHNWKAERILSDLPYEDTFNGEKMHPRFVAFFLRLGDLCDLDNDRFDRISIAAFGTLGDDNLPHYFKHKSVNTLSISKDIIHIVADVREDEIAYECKYDWLKDEKEAVQEKRIGNVFRATVKEHILWRSWMEDELKFARLNCKKIFPKELPMDLPDFEYNILINGKESASAKENMRFHFSMEKAFSLIENISIYQDEKFIFIRELVQNAIDATKLQLWRDLQSMGVEHPEALSPFEIERKHPDIYDRYPIEIIVDYDAERKTAQMTVRDCGIGISMEEFKNNILVTGNSWKKRAAYQEELQAMPEWLRPTGAFGIGLHTVFYRADQLEIHTKSESEHHANKIVLYSGKKDGFAFCQTDTFRKKRGSEFVFEFELDEAQEESLLDIDEEMEIFGDYKERFVSLIVQEVKNWCKKPLFPVYVNGECIASCLTKSEHTRLLSDGHRINTVLGRWIEHKGYEYAFSEDYREISIWDQPHGLLLNMSVVMGNFDLDSPFEDFFDTNTSFMGIRIGNGFYEEEKKIPLLHLNDIDILIGEADAVIDASRTKLNAKEIKRLQPIVYEAACFARNQYIELLDDILKNEQRSEMTADLEKLLDAYGAKQLRKNQFIPSLYQLERKYFISEYKNGLERKTLVYKLAYMLVDMQLLRDFDSLKDGCMQNRDQLEWVGNVKFPGLLDVVLKHQKSCGCKGFDEEFFERYFKNQIDDIIRCYMKKWGCLIAICYHKRNINIEHLRKCLEKTITNQMPFLKAWKRNCGCERHAIHIVNWYCGKSAGDILEGPGADLIGMFLEPTVSRYFGEWRHFGAYAEDLALPITVYGWYRNIIFMMLDGEQELDKKTVDLWKRTLDGALYGKVSGLPGKMNNNLEFLDKPEVVWKSHSFQTDCELTSFLQYMMITQIDVASGSWSITYHMGEKQTDREGNIRGYEVNQETKDYFYQEYYYQLEECDYDDRTYERMCGFADYPRILLVKENFGYNEILGRDEHWQRYIPLWERNGNIKAFLEDHSETDYHDWTNLVKESEQFERVTRYICWKKHHSYDMDKLEEIKEEYEAFLIDMFGAWYEKINGTRALG